MSDTATTVSMADSTNQLTERIMEWAKEHPEATEYCLGDELEARQLLLVIAAHLKHALASAPDRDTKGILKRYGQEMRRAVAQKRAMDYIRELNEVDQLTFIGLDIVTPEIVLQ